MKKIFIGCPAGKATGGPELLHQLCYKLNLFDYNAIMYYYNVPYEYREKDMVHPNYKKYHTPYVFEYPDQENHILIAPEIAIDTLEKCKLGQPILWWLGLDNYFVYLKRHGLNVERDGLDAYHLKERNVIHFVQCYYVKDFVQNKLEIPSNKIHYLSDYLNTEFQHGNADYKEDIILYNPKKGMDYTKLLMEAAPDFKWVAIENMTPAQVSKIMHLAKVYIDFGTHSGKDRIPREASASGCCIITNRHGSAAFTEDVPIPDTYKFENEYQQISEVIAMIQDIFLHYDTHIKSFGKYRLTIKRAEQEFDKDVKNIFSTLV